MPGNARDMHRPFCAWGLRNNGMGYMLLVGGKQYEKAVFPISSLPKAIRMAVAAALLLVVGAGAVLLTSVVCQRVGEEQEEEGGMTAGPLEGEALAAGLSDKRNRIGRSHPMRRAVWYAAGSGDAGIPEDGIADDAGAIRTDYGVRAQGKCGYAKKGMELFQCGSALCFHKCRKNQLCSGNGSGRIPCYL